MSVNGRPETNEKWTQLNKEIYERESAWGARSEDHFYERFYRDLIQKFFEFRPSFRILDLGCGDGFYFTWFARVADAFGQDIASDYVRENLPSELRSRFREGSATDLKFPDGYFDGVFLNHVIEHVDKSQVRRVLAEVRRVLKPAGKFFLATPNRLGIAEIFLDVTFRSRRRVATGHANIMTPTQLKVLLVENGFAVKQILSRSVFCYPSGLDIPVVGHYLSGYPALAGISRLSETFALTLMKWDLNMTSRIPFLWFGFEIIATATASKDAELSHG